MWLKQYKERRHLGDVTTLFHLPKNRIRPVSAITQVAGMAYGMDNAPALDSGVM